uniref:Uncharacterized protein n=1 Tax=viral metagenome TaxID=1070528 RepID=A0A6M3L1U6_9ZZZZ
MTTEIKEKLPYYIFYNDDIKTKYEGRFWSCQGNHIGIIASVTEGIDWAAYIGTDAPNSHDEDNTLLFVADWGCKLGESDARHFFPKITLPYRY